MQVEQILTAQPDSALLESIENLQASLSSQTVLIYVLIAIAVLSLLVAFAAIQKSRVPAAEGKEAHSGAAAPTVTAPLGSVDAAVVAAISAAISCVLSQEQGEQRISNQNNSFVVRRIRRV